MSSHPSSSKRKRLCSEDPGAEPAITKSKYWFDDGNVILQVENTQFRLHRSLLARHSSDFRDMFDIPQPKQTEKLDGCPLIHLSDRACDFELVMSTLYDNVKAFDIRTPMPFDLCAAILRLGKKYDIEHLLNEGLLRFRHDCPSDLSGWDKLHRDSDPIYEIASEEAFYIRCLALAHEISLNRAIPMICLSLIQKDHAYDIITMMDEDEATKDDLRVPPSLWKQCLDGRDKILCRIHRKFCDWACSSTSSPIPDKKCSQAGTCTASRANAVMQILANKHNDPEPETDTFSCIQIMTDTSLPAIVGNLICKNCRTSLKAAFGEFRAELWRDLPSLFKIGDSWEDLKDF